MNLFPCPDFINWILFGVIAVTNDKYMGFGIGTPLVTYAISLEIVVIAWSTLRMLYSLCRKSSFHLNFGRNAGSSVLVVDSPPSTRMISKIYTQVAHHFSCHSWTCHVILTCFGSYQRCHLFTVLSILLGHKLVHFTLQFLNHRVELLLQFLDTLRASLCRKEFLYIERDMFSIQISHDFEYNLLSM